MQMSTAKNQKIQITSGIMKFEDVPDEAQVSMKNNNLRKQGRRVSIQKPPSAQSSPVKAASDSVNDPFEVAFDADLADEKDFTLFHTDIKKNQEELETEEENMKFGGINLAVPLQAMNSNDMRFFRICPKVYMEGSKRFRLTLNYKAVKEYENLSLIHI